MSSSRGAAARLRRRLALRVNERPAASGVVAAAAAPAREAVCVSSDRHLRRLLLQHDENRAE
jgi:hypothetical protein